MNIIRIIEVDTSSRWTVQYVNFTPIKPLSEKKDSSCGVCITSDRLSPVTLLGRGDSARLHAVMPLRFISNLVLPARGCQSKHKIPKNAIGFWLRPKLQLHNTRHLLLTVRLPSSQSPDKWITIQELVPAQVSRAFLVFRSSLREGERVSTIVVYMSLVFVRWFEWKMSFIDVGNLNIWFPLCGIVWGLYWKKYLTGTGIWEHMALTYVYFTLFVWAYRGCGL